MPESFTLTSNAQVVAPRTFELTSNALVLPATAFAKTSNAMVCLSPICNRTPIEPPSEPIPVPPKPQQLNPFSCPTKITCPCPELPLENLSSEDLDVPVFCAVVVVKEEPPLGVCASEFNSTKICCSEQSQTDAYLCALQQGQEQVWGDWTQGDCPPPPETPPGCPPICPPTCPPVCAPGCPPDCGPPSVHIFHSAAQTCSVECADGGTFTYGLAAGKFSSAISQVDADNKAKLLCKSLAKQNKLCIVVDGDTTGCVSDYMSFTLEAVGVLTQSPQFSTWTITGPGLDVNLLTYDSEFVSGQSTMPIFGTPTIAVDTYIIARITDNNTGNFMERTISVTIEQCDVEWGNIEPTIFSSTRSYWNSGGDIPAGNYRVAYVNGAWQPSALPLWVVGDGGGSPARGYVIVYNDGANSVDFPTSGIYNSQAEAEAGTGGLSKIITHTGGRIGMYLRDSPYGDNVAGSPNPTFKLEALP